MTTQDILAKVASGELSAEKANALIAAQTPAAAPRASGRRIKLNQSGGLCVQDPDMRAWSVNKHKLYNYTLNMPIDAAAALFANAALLADIVAFLDRHANSLTLQPAA